MLPLLPTILFILVAASCFAKSSPRLHQKSLDNKFLGLIIKDWNKHRSISLKAKSIALTSILLSIAWSCYMLNHIYLQLLVIGLVLLPFIFIYRLSTTHSIIKSRTA